MRKRRVVREMLVDIIADTHNVVLDAQRSDQLKLVASVHLARRIMRRVEQNRFGARRERIAKLFLVKCKRRTGARGCMQRHKPRRRIRHHRSGNVKVKIRLKKNDFVTGVQQPHERRRQRFAAAARHRHMLHGINHALAMTDIKAARRILLRDRLRQRRHANHRRVLRVSRIDRCNRRVFGKLRAVEIRKSLRQVHCAMLHGKPRELRED